MPSREAYQTLADLRPTVTHAGRLEWIGLRPGPRRIESVVCAILARAWRKPWGRGLHALPCAGAFWGVVELPEPAPVAVDIPIALKMRSCYASAPHIKSWFFHELILRHNQPTAAPMAKVTPRSTISGLDRE